MAQGMTPHITEIEIIESSHGSGVRIHTDVDVIGEYVFGGPRYVVYQMAEVAGQLVGKNPLERERHWSELKRLLRKYDRLGLGPLDVALWDFAGKYQELPICKLLGSFRQTIPAYASTPHGHEAGDGPLVTPADYADFAETCLDLGYPGFKLHTWDVEAGDRRDMDKERELIQAVGERVGDEMDLMLDPAADYQTFAEALDIGRVCDEYGFFWYEDPMRDAGLSHHAHRTLRQKLDTPLLQTELVRGLENMTNFIEAEACDFVRANPLYDGGITGIMKRAHIAEGFGLDIELHYSGPARRQCLGAIRNTNYYEVGPAQPDREKLGGASRSNIYACGYSDAIADVRSDGTFAIPDGPGLGVSYDWDYIEDGETNRLVFS